jgi:hypothetical protein
VTSAGRQQHALLVADENTYPVLAGRSLKSPKQIGVTRLIHRSRL